MRAIVDAHHLDEALAADVISLVEELRLLLEWSVEAIRTDAEEASGSVVQFLTSRAPSVATQNTDAIERLDDELTPTAKQGKERRRASASASGPFTKKRRGPGPRT